MKKYIPILLSLACVLAFVGEASAFGRLFNRNRNVQKVVIEKQVVKEKVVVQEIKEVQRVQKFVVQPVKIVERRQAIIVEPVRSYYRVERQFNAYDGYGIQSFSSGYDCGQTQQLRQEIELLKLQQQRLQLQQQNLVMPPVK